MTLKVLWTFQLPLGLKDRAPGHQGALPQPVSRLSLGINLKLLSQDMAAPWAGVFRDDKHTFAYLFEL